MKITDFEIQLLKDLKENTKLYYIRKKCGLSFRKFRRIVLGDAESNFKDSKYNLKELFTDLYIDDYQDDAADFYEETQESIKNDKTTNIVMLLLNNEDGLIPVFEDDIQNEKDFIAECNQKFKLRYNINGIVLYNAIDKAGKSSKAA